MGQSHFMLDFPLESGRAAATLPHALTPLLNALFAAAGKLGTVHYSYFVTPNANSLLFLGHFDGGFAELMSGLAAHAGPLFDTIFRHVAEPPPSPAGENREAFVAWAHAHLVRPLSVYSAYPAMSSCAIRSPRSNARRRHGEPATPIAVLVPAKSQLAFVQMQLFLRSLSGRIARDLDTVGAAHFVQMAPLEGDHIGFFTIYRGTFDEYVAEITRSSTFDAVLKFAQDSPPSPSWQHRPEFDRFVAGARREPFGFYQAYPGLSVAAITKRATPLVV